MERSRYAKGSRQTPGFNAVISTLPLLEGSFSPHITMSLCVPPITPAIHLSLFSPHGEQTAEVSFKGPVISLFHNCEVCNTLFRAHVHFVLYSMLIKISPPSLSQRGLLYLFELPVFLQPNMIKLH